MYSDRPTNLLLDAPSMYPKNLVLVKFMPQLITRFPSDVIKKTVREGFQKQVRLTPIHKLRVCVVQGTILDTEGLFFSVA